MGTAVVHLVGQSDGTEVAQLAQLLEELDEVVLPAGEDDEVEDGVIAAVVMTDEDVDDVDAIGLELIAVSVDVLDDAAGLDAGDLALAGLEQR